MESENQEGVNQSGEVNSLKLDGIDALKDSYFVENESDIFASMMTERKNMLLQAIRDGEVEFALKLLLYGADPQSCDGYGNTALHYCSYSGNVTVAGVLLQKGVLIDAVNNVGASSLHFACEGKQPSMVKLLLENGADVSLKNISDWTALHIACRNSDANIIQLLLKAHSETDARTKKGETPLDCLPVESDTFESMRLLMMGTQNGTQDGTHDAKKTTTDIPTHDVSITPSPMDLISLSENMAQGNLTRRQYLSKQKQILERMLAEVTRELSLEEECS